MSWFTEAVRIKTVTLTSTAFARGNVMNVFTDTRMFYQTIRSIEEHNDFDSIVNSWMSPGKHAFSMTDDGCRRKLELFKALIASQPKYCLSTLRVTTSRESGASMEFTTDAYDVSLGFLLHIFRSPRMRRGFDAKTFLRLQTASFIGNCCYLEGPFEAQLEIR